MSIYCILFPEGELEAIRTDLIAMTKERNALEAECVMLRLARNTVIAQAELDRTNYVEQTRELTAEVERLKTGHAIGVCSHCGCDFTYNSGPALESDLLRALQDRDRWQEAYLRENTAARTVAVREGATPVCKCGASADPTFYSPVSGARCTACAYRMAGKVPPAVLKVEQKPPLTAEEQYFFSHYADGRPTDPKNATWRERINYTWFPEVAGVVTIVLSASVCWFVLQAPALMEAFR